MGTFFNGGDFVTYERVTTALTDDYATQTFIYSVNSSEDQYWDFVVTSLRSQNASGDFGGTHSYGFFFETQNRTTGAWVTLLTEGVNFTAGLQLRTGNTYDPVMGAAALYYRLGPADRVRITKTHSINGAISFIWIKYQRPHDLPVLY